MTFKTCTTPASTREIKMTFSSPKTSSILIQVTATMRSCKTSKNRTRRSNPRTTIWSAFSNHQLLNTWLLTLTRHMHPPVESKSRPVTATLPSSQSTGSTITTQTTKAKHQTSTTPSLNKIALTIIIPRCWRATPISFNLFHPILRSKITRLLKASGWWGNIETTTNSVELLWPRLNPTKPETMNRKSSARYRPRARATLATRSQSHLTFSETRSIIVTVPCLLLNQTRSI